MGHRGKGQGWNRRAERTRERRSERYAERQERQDTGPGPEPDPEQPAPPRPPVRAGTPNQDRYLRAIRCNDITICDGPAGSGKTHLAVGEAMHQLLERPGGPIRQILLVRPLVPAGEDPGFLPGGVFKLEGDSKCGPYMRPVLRAMRKFCRSQEELRKLFREGLVEVVPLAYLRGCTFDNTFMILDEAQNSTEDQMELFLTRLGRDSKVVASGDSTQTDLATGNGLRKAMRVFDRTSWVAGSGGACRLGPEDILRNPLLSEIIAAWRERPPAGHRLNGRPDRTTAGR